MGQSAESGTDLPECSVFYVAVDCRGLQEHIPDFILVYNVQTNCDDCSFDSHVLVLSALCVCVCVLCVCVCERERERERESERNF